MDPQVVSYVREQRRNGFSDEQIAAALRQQGYPESLVQSSLSAANEPSVADAGILKTYVESYRQRGSADEEIKASLLAEGFAEKDIAKAMQKKASHKHSVLALLAFPLLALIVLGGGYFLLMSDTVQQEPVIASSAEPVRLGEIIENLLPLANRNPEAALALCDTVVQGDKERCILTVGRESSDPGLCPSIRQDSLRDECYLNFIYKGYFEYCDQVVMESNIRYCAAVNA